MFPHILPTGGIFRVNYGSRWLPGGQCRVSRCVRGERSTLYQLSVSNLGVFKARCPVLINTDGYRNVWPTVVVTDLESTGVKAQWGL